MGKHNCKQTRTKSFKRVDEETRKQTSDRFRAYFKMMSRDD